MMLLVAGERLYSGFDVAAEMRWLVTTMNSCWFIVQCVW